MGMGNAMSARNALNIAVFASAVVGMLGCSGAEGSGGDPLGGATADGNEAVHSLAQELTPNTWGPLNLVSRNVKIARNPTRSAYEWDNAGGGNVCHGAAGTFAVTPLDCKHVSIVLPLSSTILGQSGSRRTRRTYMPGIGKGTFRKELPTSCLSTLAARASVSLTTGRASPWTT